MESVIQILPDSKPVDFNRQRLAHEAALGIHMLMDDAELTKSGFADLLGGKQKRSLVTKFLSGTHNFTLETLADIYSLLGSDLHFRITNLNSGLELPVDERKRATTPDVPRGETTDVIANIKDYDNTGSEANPYDKAEETRTA